VEQGHERRLQHLEDSRERDSRRGAPGIPPTSKSLNQWCYVGYHPTMIYTPDKKKDFSDTPPKVLYALGPSGKIFVWAL
jgi:hypothetical protein